MAKELLEDTVLKPISISLNPKTIKKFDLLVGRDQRSKKIRQLIEKYIAGVNAERQLDTTRQNTR